MSVMDSLIRYRQEREFEIVQTSELQRERLIEIQELQASAGSRVASATEDMAVEISRMAAVADWSLPDIVQHLALTAERLGGIEQMLASPTETAAAEFYRRGSFALSSGWLEEAEVDLSAAVDAYPYNPRTWFNLGIARQRVGSRDTAVEAYGRCARYGASADPGLTARAVLLSAFLHRDAGRPEESREILLEYADRLDRCAELHLAVSVHHSEHDHLVRALALAPEMVADAQAAGVAGLDDAADVVCVMKDGPVHRLRALEQIARKLAEAARDAEMEISASASPSPRNLSPGRADALVQAHRALPRVVEFITLLAAEVHEGYQTRLAVANATSQDRGKAAKVADEAQRRAQAMEDWAGALAADVLHADRVSAAEVRAAEQAVERTTKVREQATHGVALAELRRADAGSDAAHAREYATRLAEQRVEERRGRSRLADQPVFDAIRRLRAMEMGAEYYNLSSRKRKAYDAEKQRAVKDRDDAIAVRALQGKSYSGVYDAFDWEEDFLAYERETRLEERVASKPLQPERRTPEQTDRSMSAKQAWRAAKDAERAERGANDALGEAKLQESQALQDEQVAAQALRERRHAAPIEQLWQRAGEDLAERLLDEVAARRHLLAVRERLDADQREGEDRFDALQRDLIESIVHPARHLAQEAKARSLVANRAAEEAQVRVSRAAQVESAAKSDLENAKQIAAPSARIIPFDLPDQWTT